MPRIILIIDGEDSENALMDLVSNAEYEALDVAIWRWRRPWIAKVQESDLVYQPREWDKDEVIN